MFNMRTLSRYLALFLTAMLIGGSAGYVVFSLWDLPEVETLEEYKPSVTSRLYAEDKSLLAEFYLENRTSVPLTEVPEMLIQALIATEDARFYRHHGLDLRGIGRALYRNVRGHKIMEGGSTLTQQLAKILFLTPERSYARKLKEMVLALRIEQRYAKREILALYLNQIYFGSGAYGIEAAARIYFNKPARELSISECALLAGLPRSPKYNSPFTSRETAMSRRSYVLNRMVVHHVITSEQAEIAKKTPLPSKPALMVKGPAAAPYFVEYIRQKIEDQFGASILYSGGLNIYSSINRELQHDAEEALRKGISEIEARQAKPEDQLPRLQAALLAMEPSSGHILAMVGGRDFLKSQFNRAWQAQRQPGSAFKPFIYAVALERGFSATDLLEDSPLTVKLDRQNSWSPENFTHTYQGRVTVRKALVQSLNVPTIRLLEKVGIDEAIAYARKFGIKSPLGRYLSLALGSSDVSLIELTSAYAVFANHGARMEPAAILTITDAAGRVLATNDTLPEQTLRPETAYLMTYLLQGVIDQGTGWKARELGRPVAGKTGTTNDYRDAWFIGYTPSLVAGVWVGNDDQRSIGQRETGARAALPIWQEFMKKALAGRDPEEFAVPEGIIFKQIDPRTGLLSTDSCARSIREAFLPGTDPRQYCDESLIGADEPLIQDEAPPQKP